MEGEDEGESKGWRDESSEKEMINGITVRGNVAVKGIRI